MESESKRRARQILVMILLICIFIYLVLTVAFAIIKIYKENKVATEAIADEVIACGPLSFNVLDDSIVYADNSLSFSVQNTIGEPFEDLIIEISGEKYEFKLANFISGSDPQKIIIEDVDIGDGFFAYPKGCRENRKFTTI